MPEMQGIAYGLCSALITYILGNYGVKYQLIWIGGLFGAILAGLIAHIFIGKKLLKDQKRMLEVILQHPDFVEVERRGEQMQVTIVEPPKNEEEVAEQIQAYMDAFSCTREQAEWAVRGKKRTGQ